MLELIPIPEKPALQSLLNNQLSKAHWPVTHLPPTVLKRCPNPIFQSVLGLAWSASTLPQIVGDAESRTHGMELLERGFVRPRQVRYQAALRPDSKCFPHSIRFRGW